MKQNILTTLLAAGAVSAIALTTAFAQTSATTTTTTNAGRNDQLVDDHVAPARGLDGIGHDHDLHAGTDYVSSARRRVTAPVKYYYDQEHDRG